jgi:flavin-binding protein dodecin
MITVSLALARDMFDQAVEDAIKRAGLALHEVAKYEVDQFAFMQKAQQRAADYSLRGPYFG